MPTSLIGSVGAAIGESRTITRSCDVFVCGATMGGIFAAIAAKNSGNSVLIIEQHPYHIGGMSTGGLQYADVLTSPTGLWPLALDFYTRLATHYNQSITTFMAKNCAASPSVALKYLRDMLAEAEIVVNNGLRVASVVNCAGYIQSVTLSDGSVVQAKRYIDSSYEGDLMLRAGCAYTFGREANALFGETNNGAGTLADLVAGKPIDPYVTEGDPTSGLLPNVLPRATAVGGSDRHIVGYNYRLYMTKAADKIIPPDPPEYDALDYEYLGRLFAASAISGASSIFTLNRLQSGDFDFNANGAIGTNIFGETYVYPYANYDERDAFALRLKNYILGLFKFIRTDSRIPAATKADVAGYGFSPKEFVESAGFPPQVYVREAARMVGDFVFAEPEFANYNNLDGIGYGGYAIDSHYATLVNSGGVLKCEGNVFVPLGYYYPIPYRAIQPRLQDCRNLLVTYCVSATHAAFGSLRMEWTHMALGEAAGYAAALSIAQQKDFAYLNSSYIQNAVGLNPIGVVMDALAPTVNGTVTTVGAWTTATNQFGKEVYGQNYIHDNSAGKGTKTIKFTPVLPAAGSYQISVKFKDANDATRAANVPFTIQRSGGTTTGTFSQKVPGTLTNGFLSLGTYTLVGDGSDYLQIETTGTAGGTYVCVDAACFTPNFDVL